jgi:hypothetical protein
MEGLVAVIAEAAVARRLLSAIASGDPFLRGRHNFRERACDSYGSSGATGYSVEDHQGDLAGGFWVEGAIDIVAVDFEFFRDALQQGVQG